MDDKHRSFSNEKGADLCLKCTRIRFARARWWSLCAVPDPLAAKEAYFYRKEWSGGGILPRGGRKGGKGGEEMGQKERGGNSPPPSKVE